MCSPDLRDECRAVSSGKTLSSFVRSAVHIVDSHRARLPSLFNRRVFPTTPVFRYSCPSFPFVHAPSRAHYAPHFVSLEKSPRFISLQTTPASIVHLYQMPLFYQRSPLSLHLVPSSARTFSPFLFHPIHPRLVHFLDLSSSRFNHRASVSALRTLSAIVFLSPSQTPESVSFQRHSLRRAFFLQPPLSHSIHHPLHMPCFHLSFSL